MFSRQKITRWSAALLLSNMLFVISPMASGQDKPSNSSISDRDNRRALAFFANAADFQRVGKFELAIDEWQKLVKEYPDHPQAPTARHYLGVCQVQRKEPDFAQAIAAFNKALEDKDLELREESLFYLSWAEFSLARSMESGSNEQNVLLEASKTHSGELLTAYGDGGYTDQALFQLGDIERLLGNRDRSIAYYRKLLETSALAKSKLRPDATYALAVAYEEALKFPEATSRFTDFQNEFPEHRLTDEVRLRLADLLLRENQVAEAETLLAKISTDTKNPLADYALLRRGYALALQGKQDEANQQYLSLLEKFPESKHVPTAALSVGQALYSASKYDEALAQFRKVFDAAGEQAPDAAHWMAITWLRQNKAGEAVPILKQAIQLAGASPIAVTLEMDMADALYADPNQIEQALAAYAVLARDHADDPLAPRAAYNAAFAALQLGKVDEARRMAESFLSRYPQDPLRNEVAYVAAESLLRQGEHDAAAQAYAKLIKADAKNPSLSLWNLRLGMSQYLAGKYQEAIDPLTKELDAFEQKPQKAEAQFILGASYLYLQNFPKAIEFLQSSRETSGDWPAGDENLLMLSDAQQRSGDISAARTTLEELLKKYPKSRFQGQAKFKLAQLSAAAGDYKAAIDGYRGIAADDEATSYHNFANYGIAWSLMQQEQYELALKQLQPLLSQNLRDSIGTESKLAEGVCLRKLGRLDAAVESLSDFLQTQPSGTSLGNGLYELGLAYTEQGKLDLASQQFERILRELPDYKATDKVLYELAWNYQDSSNTTEATKYFGQLAREFPQSDHAAEAEYMQAESRYDAQQFADAATTYTSVLAKTREPLLLEKAQYKLGWSLFQQDKYPQAEAQFAKQASEFSSGPLAVDAIFMKAECAFKQERYAQALEGYQQARRSLEATSSSTAASEQVRTLIYLHAGQCCRELKLWDECESWLKQVLTRYPESPFIPIALYEMGFCKQNQNQLQEALASYAQVAGDYRTEIAARARFMMGEVYFSQRDFVKALPEFQRVMFGFGGERAPDDIKNWQAKSAFEAARCTEVLIENLKGSARSDVVEKAKEFYEFIVEKHAKHELAAQAQTRLSELKKLR